jgi:hypothetical protein
MNGGKGASLALEDKGVFTPERNAAQILVVVVSVEGGLCGADSLVGTSVIGSIASLALAIGDCKVENYSM